MASARGLQELVKFKQSGFGRFGKTFENTERLCSNSKLCRLVSVLNRLESAMNFCKTESVSLSTLQYSKTSISKLTES